MFYWCVQFVRSVNLTQDKRYFAYYNGTSRNFCFQIRTIQNSVSFLQKFIKMHSFQNLITDRFLLRDAMLARCMLSFCVRLSVCMSVCHKLPSWCSIKPAKRRITQKTPLKDSSFCCWRSLRNSNGATLTGAPNRGEIVQNRPFSTNISLSQKRMIPLEFQHDLRCQETRVLRVYMTTAVPRCA